MLIASDERNMPRDVRQQKTAQKSWPVADGDHSARRVPVLGSLQELRHGCYLAQKNIVIT